MDPASFKMYAASFPSMRRGLPAFAREGLARVFLPPGKGRIAESWLESSASSAPGAAARFIHYYRARGTLSPREKLRAWDEAFGRFLRLLDGPGASGMDAAGAASLAALLRPALPVHRSVIVSAEWRPGSGRYSKATVYAVTEAPLGRALSEGLARLDGTGEAWTGPLAGSHMGFLGADFRPGERLRLKIYRRYLPGSAPLEPFAAKALRVLSGSAVSVHKVYKFDGKAGKPALDKVHFTLKEGVPAEKLAEAAGAPGAGAARAFLRRAGGFARPTYLGLRPSCREAEIYFR